MEQTQRTVEPCAPGPTAQRPGVGERAESRLRRSAYRALQHISCGFGAGVLTLRGRLPSYYLKQVAQTVAATVEGVERIDNQIEIVARPAPPPEPGGGWPDGRSP
jgi:osmotically-inducible protein OsmY